MIISKDKQGNWTPTAGGTGTFIGTLAAFNAIKDTLPVNTVAYITDDGNGDLQPVDVVTNGDMHPVTSNAVYDKLDVVGQVYDISPAAFTLSGTQQSVACGSLNKGKYIIVVSFLNHIRYEDCKLYIVGGTVPVINMGRCSTGTAIQFQQTGIGFANITADNSPMVLIFNDPSGNLTGATNDDKNFWYIKAIRIG